MKKGDRVRVKIGRRKGQRGTVRHVFNLEGSWWTIVVHLDRETHSEIEYLFQDVELISAVDRLSEIASE